MAVLVEGEHALFSHEVHGLLGVWEGVLDANAVVLLHFVEQPVCLRIEAARVQTGYSTCTTQYISQLKPDAQDCSHSKGTGVQ